MDLGLRGRVALVCAASQGLGKATATGFAQEGSHVVICSRDKKRLFQTAKEISNTAGRQKVTVMPVVADLTKAKDIQHLVSTAMEEFGRIDVLVANAGGPPVGTFPELDDSTWHAGINLTLMSTVRCIREVLPHMQKRKWGRIITITSLTAKQPVNDLIISSALRPGILGLSKILASQYGKDGITVNTVAPGYMLTARQEEVSRARAMKKGISLEHYMEELTRDVPLGRSGNPEELAHVIVFLASTKSSYVNGATISVDGGLIRGLF
jgi:3-oxoacyl-[acyl-carrier protein] reductase